MHDIRTMPANQVSDFDVRFIVPKRTDRYFWSTHSLDFIIMTGKTKNLVAARFEQPALVAIDLIFAAGQLVVIMAKQKSHDAVFSKRSLERWHLQQLIAMRYE